MRLAARLLVAFFALAILLFVTKTSFAQSNATNFNAQPIPKIHTQSQNVMIESMSSMVCQLIGIDPVNPKLPCLGVDKENGKIGFVKSNGGAMGVMTHLISGTFLIPVHSSDYIAYLGNNFGLAKKTYAQGVGFQGLQPVLSLFIIFRNISYLLFVLIFIIVGVAIMLRLKIDPRTVMTIQNQIPKLIIGLVMITFAYSIAGFVIDMMWVGTYFVINTIAPPTQQANVISGLSNSAPGFANNLYQNQGGLLWVVTSASSAVGQLVETLIKSPEVMSTVGQTQGTNCGLNPVCAIGDFIAGNLMTLLANIFTWFISTLATIAMVLIFSIAILVQLFKLWFALLKSFISVLMDVILAPFWILGGLIPGAGANIGFGAWIRDLIANLAVFPAVVFLFLISRLIVEGLVDSATFTATSFIPPLIGNNIASGANTFGALIALGFILSAPGFVDTVKKTLKAGGPGLGLAGVGAGMAVAGGIKNSIGSRLYYRGRDSQGNVYTKGPLAEAQRKVSQRLYNSRLGSPVRSIRRSTVGTKLGMNDMRREEDRVKAAAKAREEQVGIHEEAIKRSQGGGSSTTT